MYVPLCKWSKEECATIWPGSALSLIGYVHIQLTDLRSQICNYMCKLYAEMNADG